MDERSGAGGQAEGRRPSDTERLVGETAASERLTDSARVQPAEAEERRARAARPNVPTDDDSDREAELGHS
jgi:hypothetical protein